MSGPSEKLLYKMVKGKFRDHLKTSVVNQLYLATKFSNLNGHIEEVNQFMNRVNTLIPYKSRTDLRKLASDSVDVQNNSHSLKSVSSQVRVTKPESTETLFGLLKRRETVREFSNRPLALGSISTILEGCYSQQPLNHEGEEVRYSVPSGGALYPLNLYVLAYFVDGLTRGVYLYNSHGQCFEHLRDIVDCPIEQFHHPPSPASPAVGILITYNVSKNYFKYASLGFKLALLEAGHLGQNILLLATSLDIKTFPSCGVDESKICSMLGIDEVVEHPIYTIWLGY